MNETSKIFLLVGHKENARILREFLAQEYSVVDSTNKDRLCKEADLIIIDGFGYRNFGDSLKKIKKDTSCHVFLPVLLISPAQKIDRISAGLWETIDEVLAIPVNKKELVARISSLLRARQQAKELKKLDEKLLQESRERINLAVKAGSIGFWDWDLNTDKVYFSKEWKEQIGYGEEEIMNEYSEWESRIHPDDLQDTLTKIKEYRENPQGYLETSFRFRHRNGSYLWILAKASLFYDDAGNPARLVGTHLDITNLKKAEQEAIEARKEAEKKEQLKTAFLQNISHEIRTPLNGIVGFIDFLKDTDIDEEEYENAVSVIEKSGIRIKNIINDLIDISKIETGQLEVERTKTDINSLIRNLYETYLKDAEDKNLSLSYYLDASDKDCYIETDESRVNQCLSHILQNAIKFTSKGEVRFGYLLRPSALEFYVKDTGRGIPEEVLSIIYEPFRQGDTKISRGYEGAGLGLAIAKASAEALGGKLWVETDPDEGSTFYCSIPAKYCS